MTKRNGYPTFTSELGLWHKAYRHVAGIDEAGRGALAGPVVAAAVVIAPETIDDELWRQIRDSKQLTSGRRSNLAAHVREVAQAWTIGSVCAATIDRINIAAATRLAMQKAIQALKPPPDYLLIDWVRLPRVNIPQESRAKADADVMSVAAASILAKVHRDHLMTELDREYPIYGFAQHKGYGTAAHRTVIKQHGPCPYHRMTFAPVSQTRTLFDQGYEAHLAYRQA